MATSKKKADKAAKRELDRKVWELEERYESELEDQPMWKPLKMTEEIEKGVMSVLAANLEERRKRSPKMGWEWDEYLESLCLRPKEQWSACENSLKTGRLVLVHGVAQQLSFLFVYDPSGKLLGSFSEHHGEDRGPNRRKRVTSLLGPKAINLV